MENLSFSLVVTRHQGLLDFLVEQGIEYDEHLTHATAEDLKGKSVLGVLPVHLACECEFFTELEMNIPLEMRGKELDVNQVREYGIRFNTYFVTKTEVHEIKTT